MSTYAKEKKGDEKNTEAVLMIFDPSVKGEGGGSSFDACTDWWETSGSASGGAVRLVVASCSSKEGELKAEDPTSEPFARIVRGWCLDNGFELVSNRNNSRWVTDYEGSDSDDRLSHGYQRIVDCLSANMWKEMVMLPRGGERGTSGRSGGGESLASNVLPSSSTTTISGDGDNDDEAKKRDESSGAILAPRPLPSGRDSGVARNAMSAEDRALASLVRGAGCDENGGGANEGGLFDADGEDGMAGFEQIASLLTEARKIREDACSGKLTNEERRERAANMMLRMFGSLDFGDDADGGAALGDIEGPPPSANGRS